RSRQSALKGGETGPALVPHDSKNSLLMHAVLHKGERKMPPKEQDRLTADEIAALKAWIDAGAPWPAGAVAKEPWKYDGKDGVVVATSGGQSADWTNRKYKLEDLWAYRPVQRPPI